MNREILFRGKNKHEGWQYGHYVRFEGLYSHDWTGKRKGEPGDVSYIYGEDNVNIGVEDETVGQFTGVVDSEGHKIFEGDILSIGKEVSVVEWDEKLCRFMIDYTSEKRNPLLGFYSTREVSVVIGNIHDTPDLIPEFWRSRKI